MIDCAVDQAFREHEHLPQPLVDVARAFPDYSLYLRAHDRWRFPDLSVQVLDSAGCGPTRIRTKLSQSRRADSETLRHRLVAFREDL
jgi:hypothetical protein